MADGIRALLRTQAYVESEGMPEALEPTNDNIRTYMLALEEEIHEYGRELNWRPWHMNRTINKERALEESGDMLAFLALLLYYLTQLTDTTPDDIARAYQEVSIKNVTALRTKRGLEVKG